MDVLKSLLHPVVYASLFALVLAIGLDATVEDALYLIRRPRKLLKAVIAISIVVPIAAVAVTGLFPLRVAAKTGIILMALAPLPPFLPFKAVKVSGEKAYVYGLFVAFALLTVVIVPVTVAILSRFYRADVSVSALAVARMMLVTVVVPIAIGMAVRAKAPRLAERAAPLINKLALLLIILVLAPILGVAWPAIRAALGDGSFAAICIIVAIAIGAGHALGGPDVHERAALAASAATRHPGIALMIVNANALDRRIVAVILLFVLVSLAVFTIYGAWMKRTALAGPPARPAVH
jgi:BASS family bile acid:Na+ symporter